MCTNYAEMSDKFDGFSQDEIKKVSGGAKTNKRQPPTTNMKQAFRGHTGIRRAPEKWAPTAEVLKKQQQTNATATKAIPTTTTGRTINSDAGATMGNTTDDTMEEVNLDRSLSKSIEEALFYPHMKQAAEVRPGNDIGVKLPNGTTTDLNGTDNSSILKLSAVHENEASMTSNCEDDSSILPTSKSQATSEVLNTDSPFKGISLKDFEIHRKMIQEQNKQKKEMLYKAIEHHSQKTAAEARKIAEIKNELAKLDNDLALDVSILRKQIDNACINYAHIEKQYMKIEAQFLKAKIDLHNAAEKKELLTEHLCTVIAHNEDRKAEKLSELMEKVGLTETGEYGPPAVNDAEK